MRKHLSTVCQAASILIFFASAQCVLSSSAHAVSEHSRASVSAETLQAKIKEVEAATDVDEETRAKLIERYRQSLTHLEKADANKGAAEDFRSVRQKLEVAGLSWALGMVLIEQRRSLDIRIRSEEEKGAGD